MSTYSHLVYTTDTHTPYVTRSPIPDGMTYCGLHECYHKYCECDDYAYLGTHSWHPANSKHDSPHAMESY